MSQAGPELLRSILDRMFIPPPGQMVRARLLTSVPARRTVIRMTTNENYYRIVQILGGLIQDEADNDTDGRDPKQATKDYVENVIDNGWISEGDDTPVWELIELLGYDRNDMDSFAVFAEIAEAIEEYDFFND